MNILKITLEPHKGYLNEWCTGETAMSGGVCYNLNKIAIKIVRDNYRYYNRNYNNMKYLKYFSELLFHVYAV